ncbi:hypothetical protein [Flavobacterium sp.]
MSERKNIDRLFQEKFKDFESNPPEDSWANIEAMLDKKKKKRVVPFWWKLSGVAAVFLIGFLISKSIYDDGTKSQTPIVNQENSNTKENRSIEDVHLRQLKENSIPSENRVVNEVNPETIKESKTGESNTKGINKNSIGNKGSNAAVEAVATTTNSGANASERKGKNKKTVFSSETAIAEKKSTQQRSLKNKSNPAKNNGLITDESLVRNQIAQNSKNRNNGQNIDPQKNQSTSEKELVQANSDNKNDKENKTATDPKNINLDGLKGSAESKIAAKEAEKKVNDTAAISVATNELEKLLNEKESTLKQKSKINRWQLASNVAPVFLGSVSNGSPIDSTLSRNSKSYNTNVGFGIGISYAVSNKLSIRTGLNKVNMSYDTNDISFFRGIQAKMLSGVQPTASSAMIHVESSNPPVSDDFGSNENELLPFENNFVHKSSGYLKQEMGYLEMPVEMTYNLLDKKFGVKIIGGFSTLFLQDDSITIVSDNRDTLLGKANNLNDVHFSTNFGVGLKYSFLKSFEFNVEPTVKYQLNTFNTNAGNFKPYLIGIYSGISYKF